MEYRRLLASLLVLSCAAGCGGARLMQLTSPSGANGKLYALSDVPRDAWPPAPAQANAPLYVSGTLKLAPNVSEDGLLPWLGSKMKAPGVGRVDLTFFIDPKRQQTTTLLMDESGSALALQRDEEGNVKSGSLLTEKQGKADGGAPGVPLWLPKWVDRYVYVNVSITQLPPEATAPFKDVVSALTNAGASMLPEAAGTPVKKFAEKFIAGDKKGPKPLAIDLTLRRLEECRTARDCTTPLADQTLVFLEREPSSAEVVKRYTLSGVELVDKAGKPYPGLAAFVEIRVDRFPDALLSAECRAQLGATGRIDAGELARACPSDELAPSDKLAFEPLRAAIAAMRQPFSDREKKGVALAELEKRAKSCGEGAGVHGLPAHLPLCTAAAGLLERVQKDDPTLREVDQALKRYSEILRTLDNVDGSTASPCDAFTVHDGRERAAEEVLRDSPALLGSGCLFSHHGEPPIRCKDLPTAEELSARYRQKRQKLAEACALDRLAKADLSAHPDQALARDFILETSTLNDADWRVMKPRADQPLGAETPEAVAEALRKVMDPSSALPPSQRLNKLVERARVKLQSLTLDYAAAARSYQAFITSIDVAGIKALAAQVEAHAGKPAARPQWLADLLRDANGLAGLEIDDLFEGSKDSYKVLGNWEELRGKSTVVRTLLRAALQELAPPPVTVTPSVEGPKATVPQAPAEVPVSVGSPK